MFYVERVRGIVYVGGVTVVKILLMDMYLVEDIRDM